MKRILVFSILVLFAGFPAGLLRSQNVELEYSTYLGGSGSDYGFGIALDSADSAYVTGRTTSSDFPTVNPYQPGRVSGNDAFISRLSSSGSSLIYTTYLGGGSTDEGHGIMVAGDEATIIGLTYSDDFPTENPFQASHGGGTRDAFVSRLSSTGSALLFSTYLGGAADDYGIGISGTGSNAYVTGYTDSTDFPTLDPYQASKGGVFRSAFIGCLSSSGSALIYSTYLSGSDGSTEGLGICMESGDAYITGRTGARDFPTVNPYQSAKVGNYENAFISCVSSSGSTLVYSTYLGGGTGYDRGWSISVEDGEASITGETNSSNFPTVNPYQANLNGGYDALVSRLSSSGSVLLFSTYLGGSGADTGLGISVTGGAAFVTGHTQSDDFPTKNPYQASRAASNKDVFASQLASSGGTLVYSTYLGGAGGDDEGYGIIAQSGQAYLTGRTASGDFPTVNPYQAAGVLSQNVFISKLQRYITPSPTPTPSSTPTPSVTPTATATPSVTPTATPSSTPSVTPTPPPSPTTTPPPTTTPTPAPTPSPQPSPTFTAPPTATPTPSSTPTPPSGAQGPPWIYDYNGDGTSDIAVFRGGSGVWAVRGVTRAYFGSSSDEIVPGDYNGDGTTEIAIFRPTAGLWAVRGGARTYFGSGSDRPEPGDYNGDGTWDVGLFRPSTGMWAVKGVTRVYFGSSADTPVPGYYAGGVVKNIGIFRGGSGMWAIRGVTRSYFGNSADTIVPGDYDGDGSWDIGIFRSSAGLWAVKGVTRSYFGSVSDQPVPADYDGDSRDDIGIFRDAAGLWAVKGISRVYFGTAGDLPATR